MIEIDDLGRSFDLPGRAPVRALDGVSFTVGRGAVTGVLGPNGAGKTTLFRILAGLLRPTSGSARIAGHDVATRSLEARERIGLLTEEPGLPDRLTPLRHVAFHVGLRGTPRDEAAARARAALEELGLAASLETPIGRLSKGNRLKVALARAIAHEPEVLLLDEPTANLDIETSIRVGELIRTRSRRGAAVLMATHDPHEAARLCDDIVVLATGRVVVRGSPTELAGTGTPGRSLEVRLSGPAQAAARGVRLLPWVASARAEGERLAIQTVAGDLPVSALADVTVVAAPLAILEFTPSRISLEQIYLSLRKDAME
ncbi:MAG TPA: ABC transporter ATP-binding protein [Candidatus Polarisedimenticolia bacterium]|jgi:ABC-type multidrug transport system ATPase subunit